MHALSSVVIDAHLLTSSTPQENHSWTNNPSANLGCESLFDDIQDNSVPQESISAMPTGAQETFQPIASMDDPQEDAGPNPAYDLMWEDDEEDGVIANATDPMWTNTLAVT